MSQSQEVTKTARDQVCSYYIFGITTFGKEGDSEIFEDKT